MMTKAEATDIQVEVEDAIRAVLSARGLQIARNRAAIGVDGDLKITLEIVGAGPDGENLKWVESWNRYATAYGFRREDRGRTLAVNGRQYTVVGLDLTRRAYPVVLRDADGGNVKLFKVADILRLLGSPAPAPSPRENGTGIIARAGIVGSV